MKPQSLRIEFKTKAPSLDLFIELCRKEARYTFRREKGEKVHIVLFGEHNWEAWTVVAGRLNHLKNIRYFDNEKPTTYKQIREKYFRQMWSIAGCACPNCGASLEPLGAFAMIVFDLQRMDVGNRKRCPVCRHDLTALVRTVSAVNRASGPSDLLKMLLRRK